MNPIVERRDGAYIVGGPDAGQPEYLPLEVTRGAHGALWSAWRPSWHELLLILLGRPIRIGILSERQPPIVVEVVECRDGNVLPTTDSTVDSLAGTAG